ncbi:hypothetical protein H4S02_000388 [Coemansia sp. RSA 2611]|nr:hypothetical protein H4S02_000388 [Coemansia sp. RSA 2611]
MDEKVFRRRIIALLNKLTPDNINVVSDDLIAWGDKSAQETDGRILRTLIELVVDKAVDEPKWIKAYTELCLRIISKTSDSVKDHNLRMVNGEYPSGGHLARKYLLQKCQGDFERGWKVTMPEAKQTDEFYEAVKIKRRGLGLVEFIGELYIADVLTVDIIKSCLRRLLSNIKTPEDEVLQSMMKLLATVGKKMDVPANKDEMDLYFSRIRSMTTNDSLDSRVRMLLMNSMELRQRKWQGRDSQEAPQTIAQLHEELERQKIALANAKRLDAQSRWHKDSDSRRGRYGTVGRSSESGRNSEIQSAGDLSRFGNLSRSKQQSAGTTPDALSSRNMFDALMDEDESPECASTKEQLTSEEIRAKVKTAIDKCISQQSDTQLVAAFKGIGETNYRTALSQTVDTIMDRRPDQVEQALGAVSALAKHNLLTEDAMTAVFAEYSDQLEDLVMDVPHALKFFGMLMAACGIPIARVSESLGKLATKVDVLRPPAMSVVSAYLKHAIKTDGEAQTQKAVEDAGFDVAQYLCADYRSDADIKKTLALQDLLCLFPKYA